MSHDRDERRWQKGQPGHTGREPDSGTARSRLQLQANFRAQQTIAGNSELGEQFQADPQGYLQRFGVHPAAPTPATPSGTMEGHVHDVHIKESALHGQGVFASQPVKAGDTICKVLNGSRDDVSPVASKVNESGQPNALPVVEGDHMVLRAVRDVPPGQEVLSKYDFPGKK